MAVIVVPLLSGAVDDRQQRHRRLVLNSIALRDAPVTITESAPGQGWHYRVRAGAHGVSIYNINLQELVAIVYGVERYAVMTNQMISASDPDPKSWLTSPRYDVRAEAPVPAPERFDPYALRQNLTKLLAERFGLEIYLNGDCQPPCGRYAVPMPEAATAQHLLH
jgi:hypothetical protein